MSVDVQNQMYTLEEALSSYLSAKKSYQLAQTSADQALKRYNVGMISLIDYKQVVDSMIDAKLIMQEARYIVLKAYFSLRHATGVDLIDISQPADQDQVKQV